MWGVQMRVINRQEYYSQAYVLHNLLDQLKYKYLSGIKKNEEGKNILSRYYLGYNLELIEDSLRRLSALKDTSVKLYFDLTGFKNKEGNLPLFNYNKEIREEDKDNFNKNYQKYMFSYDFAIDIDAKDVRIAYRDTKKIKKLFDNYKLPYSLKFSGEKGFHILILDKYFDGRIKAKNKVLLCQKLSKIIMNVCGLKSVLRGGTFDDSIYDDRRIFKLAYSLQNKDGVEFVCLPLSDEQFNNWELEDMKLKNVMKKVKLFKRGLLTRTYESTPRQLRNNLRKFIKECK
jgi:hypothetical protein